MAVFAWEYGKCYLMITILLLIVLFKYDTCFADIVLILGESRWSGVNSKF